MPPAYRRHHDKPQGRAKLLVEFTTGGVAPDRSTELGFSLKAMDRVSIGLPVLACMLTTMLIAARPSVREFHEAAEERS